MTSTKSKSKSDASAPLTDAAIKKKVVEIIESFLGSFSSDVLRILAIPYATKKGVAWDVAIERWRENELGFVTGTKVTPFVSKMSKDDDWFGDLDWVREQLMALDIHPDRLLPVLQKRYGFGPTPADRMALKRDQGSKHWFSFQTI